MESLRFQSPDPNAKVIGQAMLSFIDCLTHDQIEPFLQRHNLTHIDEKKWYPLQQWLDVLTDIANQDPNAMYDFVSIGMMLNERAMLPPEWDSRPYRQALRQVNDFGHDRHPRNFGNDRLNPNEGRQPPGPPRQEFDRGHRHRPGGSWRGRSVQAVAPGIAAGMRRERDVVRRFRGQADQDGSGGDPRRRRVTLRPRSP